MKRQMSVNGSFYPYSCKEIEDMIGYFNVELDKNLDADALFAFSPKAVIVPHAGYVYSGFTANVAYRTVAKMNYKRAIVIGPSHRVYLNGVSGSFYESYDTPCGEFQVDKEYLSELSDNFDIKFIQNAHNEHSTEVQMPFLKHYLPDVKVVEFVYGEQDYMDLSKLIEYLLKDKSNLIIISTDLSHYYDQKKANTLDSQCLESVDKLDAQGLERGACEACGKIGITAVIDAAKKQNLRSKILDYRTSGDVSGDKSAVVGYMSAVIY